MKTKAVPYEVKEGKILVVAIIEETGKIVMKVPTAEIDISKHLDILTKIDWDKIKQMTGGFRSEHMQHIIELVQRSKRDRSVLELLYREHRTDFSFRRIESTLKIPKSTLTEVLKRLQYAGLIRAANRKKTKTWTLTAFGNEACIRMGLGKEIKNNERKILEETIK